MRDLILEAARGRELEFAVRYCGVSESRHGDREHHQACPFCAGKDRFWFSPRYRMFFCRQCGYKDTIIGLLKDTNGITFQKALETLAYETGVDLPKWTPKTPRAQTSAIWEGFRRQGTDEKRQEDRMTIAMLTLAYLRFVPATDGIDFLEADFETTRKYAERLVDRQFHEIVELVANLKFAGDKPKAQVVLDCLYTGKDITAALREFNVNRAIQNIRSQAMKEHWKLEKEIETELEKLTLNKERRMTG